MNWTEISDNPICPEVLLPVAMELRSLRKSRSGYLDQFDNFITNRSVLDIGVVEHDISHIETPTWKHRYVKERAAHVLGIDIVPSGIEFLKQRGFNVRLADATSDEDLGERFERVVIGDVIEHVNNPVRLSAICKPTPGTGRTDSGINSQSLLDQTHFDCTLVRGTVVTNVDHISWVLAVSGVGNRADAPACVFGSTG